MGVDRELVEPFLAREFKKRLAPDVSGGRGGIVDEDIDAAKALGRGIDQAPEIVLPRKVGGDGDRFAADDLDLAKRFADRPW